MSKGVKYLILLVVFVLVMIGCVIGYNNLVEKFQPESVSVPGAVPATSEPDLAESDRPVEDEAVLAPDITVTALDGSEVSLSDFRGKPVILNFWATWCGPCTSEMPHFQTLYEEFGEQVEFMLVNLTDGAQETQEDVEKFVMENGYTFPVYCDHELSAVAVYGVYSIPMSLFINAEGEAMFYQLGSMSEDMLRSAIETLIGG